jgi:hypothetical protein
MGIRVLLLWLLSTSAIGSATIPALASAVPGSGRNPLAHAPAPSATPTTATSQEARSVYCLSRDQWPKLVDALAALSLAKRPAPAPSGSPAPRPDQIVTNDGRLTDLVTWSAQHPREFARACDAVVDAAAVPRGQGREAPLVNTARLLLPLVAGALLTMFTSEWRTSVDRGRLEGHTLRELTDSYLSAAETYLAVARRGTGVPGEALETAVTTAAAELRACLREQAARHPRWRRLPRLSGYLADNSVHTASLLGAWTAYQGTQLDDRRAQRVDEIERSLTEFGIDLAAVARALEHPWRPHLPLLLLRGRVA